MTTTKDRKSKRVELYSRLPEIYKIKDQDLPNLYRQSGETVPADQLRLYLQPVAEMFSAVHENIESLYHDLFIEHCDGWVIPYLADLLGTTHLAGEEWTIRADVADTIALRRRKGTLGAIELLTYILTRWGVHSVELLENLVWNQHLNHQRPDEGGIPPYSLPTVRPETPIRGGTITLRDPSLLAQLGTPFDPFAHVVDVKPHETGQIRYNIPNVAIYLWRLKDYRLNVTKPHARKVTPVAGAGRVVRLNVDPVPVNDLSRPYVKTIPQDNRPEGRPLVLFNTNRLDGFTTKRSGTDKLNLAAIAPRISTADQVPGAIPVDRVSDFDVAAAYDASLASPIPQPLEFFTSNSFTAPQEYLAVESYDPAFNAADPESDLSTLQIADVGLQFHLPQSDFPNEIWPHTALPRFWKIRGENLCAWERGLVPPLADREIAIDPREGRICIGVSDDGRADALVNDLLMTFTYAAAGPVGAHPISYKPLPKEFDRRFTPAVAYATVSRRDPARQLEAVLRQALADVRALVSGGSNPPPAIVLEIADSRTHRLDLNGLLAADRVNEGVVSMLLHCPLIIRSSDNQRPIIELVRPFAFRPAKVVGADAAEQAILDARMAALFVRLEGLYIARGEDFASTLAVAERRFLPLIARAALNRLEILNCTLDPGGFRYFNGNRAPQFPAIIVREPYGFANAQDELMFEQTPELVIQRSICGAIFTDEGYRLCLSDSIVDSIPMSVPQSIGPAKDFPFAIGGATEPAAGYACPTVVENVTILGRVRAATIEGAGAVFTGVLEAFDQQVGCLKYCYFADDTKSPPPPDAVRNRLPPHFACVFGDTARLLFTSEYFGSPGYCQLSLECDQRILEQGVGNDQMGAFNFLSEAHKWRNLKIRFREFMPVGIRPLLIPVT
jgi:hypothetical protein